MGATIALAPAAATFLVVHVNAATPCEPFHLSAADGSGANITRKVWFAGRINLWE